MIYELSELIPNDLMVSVSSFKSSSIQHDVHFLNYGPIYFKIDNKAGYTLGRGFLVTDRSLLQAVMSCTVFNSWMYND